MTADDAAAALIAESELLRDDLSTTRALVLDLLNRQTARDTTQKDLTRFTKQTAEHVEHIRKVVDKLDGLIGEVVVKVRTIKVPKFLQGLASLADGGDDA